MAMHRMTIILPPLTAHLSAHNRGVESGLLSEQVMALKKDDEGRLWVGTGAGVCVMDGSRFRPIGSAPDQPVQFLELDDLGRMWCAGTGMLGFWEEDTYHDLVPQYEREIGRIGRHLALAVLGNRPGIAGNIWLGLDDLIRFGITASASV